MNESLQFNNRKILIVDDNLSIHEDFRKVLSFSADNNADLADAEAAFFGEVAEERPFEHEFELHFGSQGEEGVELVKQSIEDDDPFAMAFVDMRMPPGMDGMETIKQIWKIDPHLQVVICTAFTDYSLKQTIDQLGASDQLLILKKPYDPIELILLAITFTEKWNLQKQTRNTISRQTETIDNAHRVLDILKRCQRKLKGKCENLQEEADGLSDQIQQQTVELLGLREISCSALAQLAESRDPETGEHLRRIQEYSQAIAKKLQQNGNFADEIDDEFMENLWRASPLHDIGKVGIPDNILLKPGPLTAAEFEIMKQHAAIGADVLTIASQQNDYGGFLEMASAVARHHHERFNGKGYPDNLVGDKIPLAARIVAVADVFDALTSARVYKSAMPPEKARSIMHEDSGTHFDPAIINAFDAVYHEILQIKSQIEFAASERPDSKLDLVHTNSTALV